MDIRTDTRAPRSVSPAASRRPAHAADPSTRVLVTAGIVAGPLFVVVGLVQVLTREGFDLTRHPLSLLALGDLGWIQIANFIVAGVLSIAFAIGFARAVPSGAASRWAPWLLGLFGAGLVVGGAFPADPGLGFPPGTPEGIPSTLTPNGLVHAFAPPVAFLSLIGACFVVARRLGRDGRRTAAICTRSLAVVCFVLVLPMGPSTSVQLFLAIALAFGWQVWLAWSLLADRFGAVSASTR